MNRVASETIKGYLYQFLESFNQVLSNPNGTVTVEGTIEDIDIDNGKGEIQAIQCKYFEAQSYSISAILPAILELFMNYKINIALNKNYKYKLFVYIQNNQVPTKNEIVHAINNTKNTDVIVKYLANLYVIQDSAIKKIIDKKKKSNDDKESIIKYIDTNRNNLSFCTPFDSFWNCFEYKISKKYDLLMNEVKNSIANVIGTDEGDLYYSNGISKIAELSSKSDESDRKIECDTFIQNLKDKKQLLYTKWSKLTLSFDKIKSNLKKNLKNIMGCNSYIRVFYLSSDFCNNNKLEIINYIIGYIDKYYKKPKLNKKPIFIFEDEMHSNFVMNGLYDRQIYANNGRYNNIFKKEWLKQNFQESNNYKLIIINEKDLDMDTFNELGANYLFNVSDKINNKFESCSIDYINLNLDSIEELRYVTQV